MMSDKEQLLTLLTECIRENIYIYADGWAPDIEINYDNIANYLIAHGVKVENN